MKPHSILFLLTFACSIGMSAQTGNKPATLAAPISKADLGKFPYLKTVPDFKPGNADDSVTFENSRTYFLINNKVMPIDGIVSSQQLQFVGKDKKPSVFQLINDFDRVITTVGGQKIYEGKITEDQLKTAGVSDMVGLYRTGGIVRSAHYGIVEWKIVQPDKEVYIQLEPYSLPSNFYGLLVVEKQINLVSTNINKKISLADTLAKSGKFNLPLQFVPDEADLASASSDALLDIVKVFQQHPDWKLRIEVYVASLPPADYALKLTQDRAAAITARLAQLGVKAGQLEVQGMGDASPVASNGTEKGRIENTRIVIVKK